MILVPKSLSRSIFKDNHSYSRSSKPILLAQRPRYYSSLPIVNSPSHKLETEVKAGIGSSTKLRITFATRPEINGPIILNLGRGIRTLSDNTYTRELCLSANATVVEPEYYVLRTNPYPAPIHMTVAVYDWIWRNLMSGREQANGENHSRLGICGELAAGSLAAMLALTECKMEYPRVSAAAIGNPILDWTDIFPQGREMRIDDLQSKHQNESDESDTFSILDEPALSVSALMVRRKDCFRKPEDFFDPFASPTLFFRTPCFDLPYQPPHPLLLEIIERSDNKPTKKSEDPSILKRKRLYHRAYPPLGSRLELPPMKFAIGDDFVLRDQALELASLMRRSVRRRRGIILNTEEDDISDRFTIERKKGLGLWGAKDAIEIGQWFGEVLRGK